MTNLKLYLPIHISSYLIRRSKEAKEAKKPFRINADGTRYSFKSWKMFTARLNCDIVLVSIKGVEI